MKNLIKLIFKFFGLKLLRRDSKNYEIWPIANLKPETIYENDIEFHEKYNDIMKKLDMIGTDNPLRRNRHYLLYKIIKNIIIDNTNVAECGCWKGLSTKIISEEFKKKKFKDNFFIFDSFEGLSEFHEEDLMIKTDNFDQEKVRKHFSSNIETLKSNLSEYNNFIILLKGWIPSRFEEVKDKNFSFVHIDVDLYQPTLDSLNFFNTRMIKNGIILLDDYGSEYFPGAKLATDKFLENNSNYFFLPLSFGSAILIKK